MRDSFFSFILWVSITASIAFVLSTIWSIAELSISKDCERLGGFYVEHKAYKCEVVK